MACLGEGGDMDRRCEDVRLTTLPPRRSSGGKQGRGRRALGRDYTCNCVKAVNPNEDFPEMDFFLFWTFQEKESESKRLVISWRVGCCL